MTRRLLQIGVSLVLCGVLVSLADWRAIGAQLVELDPGWLAAGLALFVPQTIVSAWRWKRMIADVAPLKLSDSLRHTLAASTLNLVVPSKLGDFSKAAFVPVTVDGGRKRLAKLVAVEKGSDLAVLLSAMLVATCAGWLGVVGALVVVLAAWMALSRAFVSATLVLWTLHLTQIHCFLLSADVPTSWLTTAARVPAALLAGIVPAAFCGIGTRDAALVQLYADSAPAATMLVVGLLTSLRYVVPGAIGIPLLVSLRRRPTTPSSPIARSTSRRPLPRPVATSATA